MVKRSGEIGFSLIRATITRYPGVYQGGGTIEMGYTMEGGAGGGGRGGGAG